jgi:ribosomal protein S21
VENLHGFHGKEAILIMVLVKKQKGESDDRLIARFRKKVIDSGLLVEYRDRERFKKDSEKRKEKKYKMAFQIQLEKKRNG